MNRTHVERIALIVLFSAILWSCNKLDVSDLGQNVIPEVDNVNTFADTLDIETMQGFFTDQDTLGVANTDLHVLGQINNDPLFGKTTADVFMQLKPSFYPFYLGSSGDTRIELDSVVLCLNYTGYWGDSTQAIGMQVFEVNPDPADIFWDTTYAYMPTTYAPQTGAAISPVHQIRIEDLKNFVKLGKGNDSLQYQIRLKLDNSSAFVQNLYNSDSSLSSINNGFYNDSAFRKKFPGLAVMTSSGNALLYTTLTDFKTRLEVHFKRNNADNVRDTIYTSFLLAKNNTLLRPSTTANKVTRDRSFGTYPTPNVLTDELYIQGGPGTYASLKIPGLTGYPNRVIHRASIEMFQIPGDVQLDSVFTAPNYLYIDLKDTGSVERYKSVYFDLNPASMYDPDKVTTTLYYPYQLDLNYYGGFIRRRADPISNRMLAYYNINLTRYVQQIATHQRPNYEMRLYAPFQIRYTQHSRAYIPYNNVLGQGRVRLGGGNNSNYKMRMIIIYSNV